MGIGSPHSFSLLFLTQRLRALFLTLFPLTLSQVRWDNAVVIFDEAHNVEGVCSDASSWDITSRNITDAIEETKE